MALDFDTLTPNQLDALDGPHREAWYAHCRGDHDRRDAILAAYPDLEDPVLPDPAETVAEDAPAETVAKDAPAETETADAPAAGEVETATPAKPAKRAPAKKAPAKKAPAKRR